MFLDNAVDRNRNSGNLNLKVRWKAPFSIQNFVEHSFYHFNKKPGEWYGTNSAANVLESLNSHYKPIPKLEIVVFNDLGINEKEWYRRAMIECTWGKNIKKQKSKHISDEFIIIDSNGKVRLITKI